MNFKKLLIFTWTFSIMFFAVLLNSSYAETVVLTGGTSYYNNGYLQYDTNISITIDTSTNKATVKFSTEYCGFKKPLKYDGEYTSYDKEAMQEGYASNEERYLAKNNEEGYKACKETLALWNSYPTSATAIFDVAIDSGIYKYLLTNPQYQGEKYVCMPGYNDNGSYYANLIRIRKNQTLGVNHEVCVDALIPRNYKEYGTKSLGLRLDEVSSTTKEEPKFFKMFVDSFNFENTTEDFFGSPSSSIAPTVVKKESYEQGTLGYYISESLYKNMISGMSDLEKTTLHYNMSKPFSGSCFGMTNLASLLYDGRMKLSSFSSIAKTTYELACPIDNNNLAKTLAYYQLIQARNSISGNYKKSDANGEKCAKEVVDACLSKKQGDVLGNIGVYIDGLGYHAVLGYKIDKTSNGYDITIYDPNYKNSEGHIIVSSDYKTVTMSNYSKVKLLEINDPVVCDESYLIRNMKGIDDSSKIIILVGSGNVKAKVGNNSIEVDDGEISSQNGDIGARSIDGQTIITSDGDGEDIEVESDGDIGIFGEDESISANGKGNTTISKSGEDISIKSNGNTTVEFITNYKRKGGLTRVETTSSTVRLRRRKKNDEEILAIETNDNSKVDVEVGSVDGINYRIDDVDTSKKSEIKINDNNVEVIENDIVVKTVTEQGTLNPQVQGPIDITPIVNKAKEKANDFSERVIEKIKTKNDTVNKFKNKGYRHSSWAEEEVARADELGIIPYSIINKLQSNITRKEFCEIAYQTVKSLTGMSDSEMKAFCSTPDANTNKYAYQYSDTAISFAYGTGIVNGYPDGSFGPNDLITRAQAAKMLVVTAEIMGKMTSESNAKWFNDNPNDWSQTYINKISSIISPYTDNRVMGGDDKGNFMPLANYTCEQAVLTMERLIENVIGENANYNGGTVKAEETKTPTFTSNDNDQTYYNPKGWSWTREGSEGYGRKYFTSGKYVREDGRAVLYVESSDSPDFFAYQLYALPEGAKQSAYESYKSSGNWSYADNTTQTGAYDEQSQLYFWEDGRQEISVTIGEWMDELIYEYGSPEGLYKLVREK